ncbi:hypothetical protein [Rhizobacter sp. SG703]|uniref:hypothetical protein n=1 Tax=Rhizobacter sp. SG703 TaxID=2587140 RepID=UPI0014489565|nr:hypothetical protein [Rhizobacter sp. SG703]NKI97066.1 hypothetical protein [Rhizobacter sp. SG703]
MSINEIKRPPSQGLSGPTLNRPGLPSRTATPEGARTRGSNAARDALPTRAQSRSTSGASSRTDTAREIASNVCQLVDSGALRMRESVTPAVMSKVAQSAARKVLDLYKAFPQLAA